MLRHSRCIARPPTTVGSLPLRTPSKGKIMDSHKFKVGQMVSYLPGLPEDPFSRFRSLGLYEVIQVMPERDGEFQYKLKSTRELHSRMASEERLQNAG